MRGNIMEIAQKVIEKTRNNYELPVPQPKPDAECAEKKFIGSGEDVCLA
jgi:hypothetical protein